MIVLDKNWNEVSRNGTQEVRMNGYAAIEIWDKELNKRNELKNKEKEDKKRVKEKREDKAKKVKN